MPTMRASSLLMAMPLTLSIACGGGAASSPDTPSPSEPPAAETPPPELASPRAALATAHFACAGPGERTLTYVIEETPRACADGTDPEALTIVHYPGTEDRAPRFEWRLGEEHGEGPACVAPSPCDDAAHSLTIVPGDPLRIEWTLSLGEEGGDHGSAAVLLCNEDPGPAACP